MPDTPGMKQAENSPRLAQVLSEVRAIKAAYVDKNLGWYEQHRRYPFFWFRVTGMLTILLSATIPVLALSNPYPRTLAGLSVAVAALTGLGTFYRWDRSWGSRTTAKAALEHLSAKWELEITNATLVLAPEDQIEHIYLATDDLLTNVRTVLSTENDGFFSGLQFPQADSVAKKRSEAAGS